MKSGPQGKAGILNNGVEIPATVLGAARRGDWPTLPQRHSSLKCAVTARAALLAIPGSLAREARCGQSPLPAAFGVAGISTPLFRLAPDAWRDTRG